MYDHYKLVFNPLIENYKSSLEGYINNKDHQSILQFILTSLQKGEDQKHIMQKLTEANLDIGNIEYYQELSLFLRGQVRDQFANLAEISDQDEQQIRDLFSAYAQQEFQNFLDEAKSQPNPNISDPHHKAPDTEDQAHK